MGAGSRTPLRADFRSQVALEAIRSEQTLAAIRAKHWVHVTMVAAWKQAAIDGMAATFSPKAKASVTREAELAKLHAKIEQLVRERDFLAKASGR
jgi:transposase